LQKSLNACEAKYLKEFQEMSDELSRREQIHVETEDKPTAAEEELKLFKEKLKAKEREYSTNITKYQEKIQASQSDFDKTFKELSCKIEEQTILYQREVQNLTGEIINQTISVIVHVISQCVIIIAEVSELWQIGLLPADCREK